MFWNGKGAKRKVEIPMSLWMDGGAPIGGIARREVMTDEWDTPVTEDSMV